MKIIQNNFNIYQNQNNYKNKKKILPPAADKFSNENFTSNPNKFPAQNARFYQNYNHFNLNNNFNNSLYNSYPISTSNLISFGAKRTSTTNFDVKNILNLRCPICNQIMLSEEQEIAFANDIAPKTGEKLIKALEFYEDERNITQDWENGIKQSIFRKSRREIVEIIKKLAAKYPNSNLKDLIAIYAKPILEDLTNSQLKVINELKNYIYENLENEEELNDFDSALNDYIEMINGNGDYSFSRAFFLKEISKVTRNKEAQKQINLIAQKMPAPQNYVDTFFIKASKYERQASKKIAKSLFHQSTITVEHLQPKSKNGKDRASNYICDCANCNTRRGSTDFKFWMEEIPDLDSRLQNYIAQVEKAINNGEISTNYSYLRDIKETIKTLSDGRIDLKVPQNEN